MHTGKEPARGFLPALKAETGFLFSGQGMPYEKVCIMVAMVVSLVLGIMLSDNIAKESMNRELDTQKIIEDIQRRSAQKIECRRILVPTDGSGQAFKAVQESIALARTMEADITFLMAIDLNKHVSAFEQVSLGGYVPSELTGAAYNYLMGLVRLVPRELCVRAKVEVGNPGEVITRVAEEEGVGLIVMGSRGFGTFHSLVVGSVSRYVLSCAPCPVLIVKGLPDDWEDEDTYRGWPPQD